MARTVSKNRVYVGEHLRQMPEGIYNIPDLIEAVKAQGLSTGSGGRFIHEEMKTMVEERKATLISRGLFKFGGVIAAAPSMEPPETPDIDPDFQMSSQLEGYVSYLQQSLASGNHEHFRVIGPKGTGKTEGGMQLAARLGLPCLVMDCSIIREPRDFFGMRDVSNGRTYWTDGAFTSAVESGNCVIVLDEINRASDMVGNALLPLLDRRRATLVQERGNKVVCGPGILWWATANIGSQYSGTNALDAALADRFGRVVEVDYLKPAQEVKLLVSRTGVSEAYATALVEVAHKTRVTTGGISAFSTPISTRQLLAAAHDLRHIGVSTLGLTIGNLFNTEGDSDSERSTIMNMLVGKFDMGGA